MYYKVLLVDDEILVRDAIRENLDWHGLGYELVADCSNGKEAMEYVKKNQVDLVITDICMPFVDGMQLSEFLYNNYPEILIIVFSGFGEFGYAKKAIQYKVSEYILKPVTALELSEVLTRLKDKLDRQTFQEKKLEKLQNAYKNYRKNEALIASRSLCNLVMGTQDIAITRGELKELGFQFEASDYRVAVVDIDIYSSLYEVDEASKKESALMSFVVENISNEIIEKYHAGVAFKDSNNRVFMLLETNTPKEFLNKTHQLCREIQESIFDAMKLTVSITIGQYVQKLEELHVSYDDAMQALNYRYTRGDSMMVDCVCSKNRFDSEVNQDKWIEQLKKAVKNNQIDEIECVFSELEKLYVNQFVKRERIIIYLQQISRELVDLSFRLKGNSDIYEKRNRLLDAIIKSKSCRQAVEEVREYAVYVANELSDSVSTSAQRQAMLAMSYIKENYWNPDLNLNHICNYLNISTSYFSSLFKEETGETFMEVLIRVRMNKAKELLEQTTLKNYEIAERVGFSDPHYFGISFKKMTGMSPTEYVKEKRKNEQGKEKETSSGQI